MVEVFQCQLRLDAVADRGHICRIDRVLRSVVMEFMDLWYSCRRGGVSYSAYCTLVDVYVEKEQCILASVVLALAYCTVDPFGLEWVTGSNSSLRLRRLHYQLASANVVRLCNAPIRIARLRLCFYHDVLDCQSRLPCEVNKSVAIARRDVLLMY